MGDCKLCPGSRFCPSSVLCLSPRAQKKCYILKWLRKKKQEEKEEEEEEEKKNESEIVCLGLQSLNICVYYLGLLQKSSLPWSWLGV